MKLIILLTFSLGFVTAHADEYVNPYMKKDGTEVNGYHRTSADDSKANNYSATGNVNPYTGKEGNKDPYASSSKSNEYSYGH